MVKVDKGLKHNSVVSCSDLAVDHLDLLDGSVASLHCGEVGKVGQEEELVVERVGPRRVGALWVEAVDDLVVLGLLLEGRELGLEELVHGGDRSDALERRGHVDALCACGGDPLADLRAVAGRGLDEGVDLISGHPLAKVGRGGVRDVEELGLEGGLVLEGHGRREAHHGVLV